MGTEPSRRQRKTRTQFLRIHLHDWPAIVGGDKTEFRNAGRYAPHPILMVKPSPIVCWVDSRYRDRAFQIMVLEDAWQEPLGSISPESLRNEGFESVAEFRRYWRNRHHGVLASYKPLSTVSVYRLRPWAPGDLEEMGHALLNHLYGPWVFGEEADA